MQIPRVHRKEEQKESDHPKKKMEVWLLIFLSLSLATVLSLLLRCQDTTSGAKKGRLPPGPQAVPIIGNLLLLRRSFSFGGLELLLRDLRARYGPIVTLHLGSRPLIYICDRAIAHLALIAHGAAFSDRPKRLPATRIFFGDQHNISSAGYGPLWRLLRRNLISEILHSSRVKLYATGRSWVLGGLLRRLRSQADSSDDNAVVVLESFQFAIFSLLVFMCFGEKLDDKTIKDIEIAQRRLLRFISKINVLSFLPSIFTFIFRKRLKAGHQVRRQQFQILAPLVRARQQYKQKQKQNSEEERLVYSYVDSLLDVELAEEGGRKLTEEEILILCSEFLNAGTDTSSTTLQWILANLVKHQDVQAKLLEEIEEVVGKDREEIREEDLGRMPYLKAVILEGLRRHPPGHFVLPHTVTEDVILDGYLIPKGAVINFTVAEMGWDGKVWEEPMKFKPERFLAGGSGEGVDITGSREIKMMPFGAGRRICPGLGLAMLHLEYFVANLVRELEWKPLEGEDDVDLSEKTELATVMKNPLRARILPRRNPC